MASQWLTLVDTRRPGYWTLVQWQLCRERAGMLAEERRYESLARRLW
jgi:hypothetical protein